MKEAERIRKILDVDLVFKSDYGSKLTLCKDGMTVLISCPDGVTKLEIEIVDEEKV